jgi:hypothetical protein
LTEDLRAGYRFNAARAAALAGGGRVDDVAWLGEPERGALRKQARDWLRLDLAAWTKKVDIGTEAERIQARKTLAPWRDVPDLARLRARRRWTGCRLRSARNAALCGASSTPCSSAPRARGSVRSPAPRALSSVRHRPIEPETGTALRGAARARESPDHGAPGRRLGRTPGRLLAGHVSLVRPRTARRYGVELRLHTAGNRSGCPWFTPS